MEKGGVGIGDIKAHPLPLELKKEIGANRQKKKEVLY